MCEPSKLPQSNFQASPDVVGKKTRKSLETCAGGKLELLQKFVLKFHRIHIEHVLFVKNLFIDF